MIALPRIRLDLTNREILVLKLVAKGCTVRQIAADLFISVETVRKHLKNSYKKLGACNRIQALKKAGMI
jgi:DNA-binding NarL/FixJ family response regulator